MINKQMNAYMSRLFKPVDNVVWDIMSGKLGVMTNDGIMSLESLELNDDKTEISLPQIMSNVFTDFGISIPAFAQSTPSDAVNLGDMIYSSNSNKVMGWVVKKSNNSFRLMKPDGTTSNWTPPKVQMLGFDSGVMVLKSLINMFGGDTNNMSSFTNNMMPLLMMSGDKDISSMIPMMFMMQGQGNPAGSNNPMSGMMQMMMMQKMMGNDSGGGMFDMFSSPKSSKSPNHFRGNHHG